MEVSSGRLNGIRVVLVVGILMAVSWGIGNLFFAKSMFESVAPAGETFTAFVESQTMNSGALALSLAVGGVIALWSVLRNPGLILFFAIAMAILGAVSFYLNIFGPVDEVPVIDWVISSLNIVLFVALVILYPWRGRRAI